MTKVSTEQRKARRLELAAKRKAEEERSKKIERLRHVLAEVYHSNTGNYATEYMLGSDDVEDEVEYDSPAFVDWLILRYVAAARASYAMTEADGQRILDGRQKTEQRELAPKP